MASGTIKNQTVAGIEFESFSFPLPTVAVSGGNYYEWTGIDIHKDGYEPIGFIRVTSNKSNVVLCGFTLNRTSETIVLFVKNISQSAITVDQASVHIIYRKL